MLGWMGCMRWVGVKWVGLGELVGLSGLDWVSGLVG